MTETFNESFKLALLKLFADFRIKGVPEHELVKAMDDFLECSECEEETCTCPRTGQLLYGGCCND